MTHDPVRRHTWMKKKGLIKGHMVYRYNEEDERELSDITKEPVSNQRNKIEGKKLTNES